MLAMMTALDSILDKRTTTFGQWSRRRNKVSDVRIVCDGGVFSDFLFDFNLITPPYSSPKHIYTQYILKAEDAYSSSIR